MSHFGGVWLLGLCVRPVASRVSGFAFLFAIIPYARVGVIDTRHTAHTQQGSGIAALIGHSPNTGSAHARVCVLR